MVDPEVRLDVIRVDTQADGEPLLSIGCLHRL